MNTALAVVPVPAVVMPPQAESEERLIEMWLSQKATKTRAARILARRDGGQEIQWEQELSG